MRTLSVDLDALVAELPRPPDHFLDAQSVAPVPDAPVGDAVKSDPNFGRALRVRAGEGSGGHGGLNEVAAGHRHSPIPDYVTKHDRLTPRSGFTGRRDELQLHAGLKPVDAVGRDAGLQAHARQDSLRPFPTSLIQPSGASAALSTRRVRSPFGLSKRLFAPGSRNAGGRRWQTLKRRSRP